MIGGLHIGLNRARMLGPSSLFANNEQGVWYDPSDTATLFQDSAGTTPVTAVEQPVGLMLDMSKGLVLGSELVTNGDFSSGTTGWATVDAVANTTTVSGGELVNTVSTSPSGSQQLITTVAGRVYRVTGRIRRGTSAEVRIRASNTNFAGTILAESAQVTSTVATPVSFVFTATSTQTSIYLRSTGVGTSFFDNISVRELPGNHAFQTTATSRPVLSARYNLLTNTGFSGAAVGTPGTAPTSWSLFGNGGTTNSVTSDANGNNALTYSASAARQFISQAVTANVNTIYRLQVQVGSVIGSIAVGEVVNAFAWPTGTTVAYFINGVSASSADTLPANSSVEIVISVGATAGTGNIRLGVGCTVNSTATVTFSKPDLRVTNDAAGQPAYQRVNTATDYDTAGFKPYLRFDGTDDWLQTNSINFTGTDKMTVFAGVRKLSDAAAGTVAELSINSGVNNSTIALFAPGNPAQNYAFRSRGTLDSVATATPFASPTTNILTGFGDIAADVAVLRVNGAQAASASVDQGAGNYGSYPLYIGRRAGTVLPFNGRLTGLIAVGSTLTAQQITNTENWLNQRTGAF